MANVKFEDFTLEVQGAIDDKINAALEECAGLVESQTKRNTRVDTGKTKNSWQHHVDEENHVAYVGSNYENAIWEEFGTGEHALKGDGRKGGWGYEDPKTGEKRWTYGKKPSRALFKAFTALKGKITARLQNAMKGL